MKIYLVGGAVRDPLLGLEARDKDFVVVGATENEMIALGYRQVGRDFPVFLDAHGDEYSLARRSRAYGSASFGPEVTLEEDLQKRDLTINAIAMDPVTKQIIDPCGGQRDLAFGVLRKISTDAFIEDPIRVLRVARFAARFPDFVVAPTTRFLMTTLVSNGALNNLVPERVWKEISRGLMEQRPSRMLQVLRACGALGVIMPELNACYGVPQPVVHHPEVDTGVHIEQVLDYAARCNYSLEIRFAAMLHDLGKGLTDPAEWPKHHAHEIRGVDSARAICNRLKVPLDCRDLALMATREHGRIHSAMVMKTASVVKVLRQCDAFRRVKRFEDLLRVAECDARGRVGPTADFSDCDYPQAERLSQALRAAMTVQAGPIAMRFQGRPDFIQQALHAARARAVRAHEVQVPQ